MQENTNVQLPSRRQVRARLIRDFVLCALIFGTLESPRIVGYFRISQGLTQIRDYWDAWLEAPWLSLPVILLTVVVAACLGFVTAPLLQQSFVRWTAADNESHVRRKLLRFQMGAAILNLEPGSEDKGQSPGKLPDLTGKSRCLLTMTV